MQALALNEVPSRVVAWHNRHPLARRIRTSQVHSVGTVLLPFASARTWPDAPAAAPAAPQPRSGPSLAEVVSARAAARPGAQDQPPDERATAAADFAPDEAAAIDRNADDGSVVESDEARSGTGSIAHGPSAMPSAAPPPGWLQRLLSRLSGIRPGTPRLVAAFGRDLVWPLTLHQVARWARRHGQPAGWPSVDMPHREVAADPARLAALRQKGMHETLHLQLLTAAVGVGDRRLRLLLDRQGRVLGPRVYSRPRVAGAAGLCVAGLLAMGGPGWLPVMTMPAEPAAPAAAAGSAPAPTGLAESAEAAASALAPLAAASAVAQPAPPDAAAPAAPQQSAVAAASLRAEPASNVSIGVRQAAETAATAPSSPVAPTVRTPSPAPDRRAETALAPPGPARAPGHVRPSLSDDEKRAAREASNLARGQSLAVPMAATAPAGPVYAVVTQPSAQRDAAARGLALMQSARARLATPAPDRGELMHSQGAWRAAWWPFTSLADAERARVMLASRGLKAEVVAF